MPLPSLPTHVRTVVVGAGFAGLCAAIELDRSGEGDFVVLERGSDVGGTWRDNTYPGAACDVPSQLYSFSFAPNPDWSRSFSPQPEIQAYLRRVAAGSGVLDRIRFDTALEEARWDDDAHLWRVRTTAGTLTADVLVAASGSLSDPRLPDLDGLDSFAGDVFHSSRWRHDRDLTGARVAVVGTGASAVQIVPGLVGTVAHLDVYQRTAPHVVPRGDRAYTRPERWAFRHLPAVQRAYRTAVYWARESFVPAFVWEPRIAAPAVAAARANIRRGISDPVLRAKVTPTFTLGCKRVLISNDWYPALDRDDVDLVTEPIARVTPTGIVTADGTERAVDVIVVATGFLATDLPIARRIHGRGGTSLAQHFAEHGMQAYKGATVHGFPNLFFLVGPNTGLGHSSMIVMIEAQVAYLVDALAWMRRDGVVAVEPARDVQDAWNQDLQRRMRRTVWSRGGCSSWYLDRHGRNVTLWPRTTYTFRRLTARFDQESYVATVATEPDSPTDRKVTA
jgi:cation diffusion facilitator CzcD-associated flavoprotein CzcO